MKRELARIVELVSYELGWRSEATPLGPNETAVWKLARDHKVATILAPKILELNAPSEWVDEARQIWQMAALRETYYVKRAEDLITLLGAHGIRAFALKGVPLAKIAYPKRGFRAFRDLDLLVRPEQVTDADRVLRSDGFVELHPPTPLRRAVKTKGSAVDAAKSSIESISYQKEDLFLEVHTCIVPWIFGRYPLERVWSEKDGFSAEDFMIHLMIHATRHHFLYGLRHLVDIAVWMPQMHSMEVVRERLESANLMWLAWPAWKLASETFPEIVPSPPAISNRRVHSYTEAVGRQLDQMPHRAIALAGTPIPFLLMGKRLGTAFKANRAQTTYQTGNASRAGEVVWKMTRPFGLAWRHAPALWALAKAKLLSALL